MNTYYTYILRSNLKEKAENGVIYVGKGSGNRMNFHVEFANTGYGTRKDSKLYNKIRKVYQIGGEIVAEKVFETNDESKAFNKEVELIKEYGKKNLCNLTFGGEGVVKYDWAAIRDWVDKKSFFLSDNTLDLLRSSIAYSPSKCRNAKGKPLDSAASIIYETLPEAVKDIISAPKNNGAPQFIFDYIPLCEVVACVKYNLPNYHYNCGRIFFIDGNLLNCSDDNLILFSAKRIEEGFDGYLKKMIFEYGSRDINNTALNDAWRRFISKNKKISRHFE